MEIFHHSHFLHQNCTRPLSERPQQTGSRVFFKVCACGDCLALLARNKRSRRSYHKVININHVTIVLSHPPELWLHKHCRITLHMHFFVLYFLYGQLSHWYFSCPVSAICTHRPWYQLGLYQAGVGQKPKVTAPGIVSPHDAQYRLCLAPSQFQRVVITCPFVIVHHGVVSPQHHWSHQRQLFTWYLRTPGCADSMNPAGSDYMHIIPASPNHSHTSMHMWIDDDATYDTDEHDDDFFRRFPWMLELLGQHSPRSRIFGKTLRQLALNFGFVVILPLSTLMLALSSLIQFVSLWNLMQKQHFGRQARCIRVPPALTFDPVEATCRRFSYVVHSVVNTMHAASNTLHSGTRLLSGKHRYIIGITCCFCIGASLQWLTPVVSSTVGSPVSQGFSDTLS